MHSHHCSYLSPGAKAPDHQYSQCWLNSRCTETVSYKNITLMVNNIRKYSGINTCMLVVSGLWLCKHSRQLHSPSLVAIGRSVGYETWPPILYYLPKFSILQVCSFDRLSVCLSVCLFVRNFFDTGHSFRYIFTKLDPSMYLCHVTMPIVFLGQRSNN